MPMRRFLRHDATCDSQVRGTTTAATGRRLHTYWTWRFAARITGCFKRVRVPPDVKSKVVDKDAASRSLRALDALPIQKLVVAHGAVIDEAPVARLREAWRLVGVGA